ncbi:MAG: hypothetical protein ACFFD4_30985 [Candidatus Odinarchaeota archaeon]
MNDSIAELAEIDKKLELLNKIGTIQLGIVFFLAPLYFGLDLLNIYSYIPGLRELVMQVSTVVIISFLIVEIIPNIYLRWRRSRIIAGLTGDRDFL